MTILFLSITFSFCNNRREAAKTQEYIEISQHAEGDIYQLASTPMALLTDEQFNVAKSIAVIIRASVVLDDNKIINTATSSDFEKLGIPVFYYYILKETLVGLNKKIHDIEMDAEEVYNSFMRSIDDLFETE